MTEIPVSAPVVNTANTRVASVTINHVALSVTDIDKAIQWYQDVFALRLLVGPIAISSDMPGGEAASDILGPKWRSARLAHMVTASGEGVELFEFTDPIAERRADNFEYWKTGIFHLCLTAKNVSATVDRIVLFGGKQRSKLHEFGPDRSFCFCEDPFGNVLEIMSHPYEEVFTPPLG